MVVELAIRFVIGGLVVTAFAVLGDALKPKSFAGLFGAAPSVALATLGMAFFLKGGSYSGIEGRSMIAGAIGLAIYSLVAAWLIRSHRLGALASSAVSMAAWFAATFAIWGAILR